MLASLAAGVRQNEEGEVDSDDEGVNPDAMTYEAGTPRGGARGPGHYVLIFFVVLEPRLYTALLAQNTVRGPIGENTWLASYLPPPPLVPVQCRGRSILA